MLRLVLLALLIGICAGAGEQTRRKAVKAVKAKALSRGWGRNITWVKDYEEGLLNSAVNKKPLMVIHHREDCPHSEALKKAFVAEKNIQKMAKLNFIMLNLVEEPEDENMSPDGFYVPRILFVDPSMRVRINIVGKYNNRLYAYEPDDMEILAQNMKKAKVLLHTEL
ncbi:anterior gradient 1 [Pleuronectes platessa]|uniref:anterior gradient 1 n=1 Tax=Pleuronectes platessa TaxID=8262 RepID=UPI00232A33B7|nr:anterior gradient 1 [Pleuronectes platessa]XP_053295532.1 anterior gradient 1 [Pleuronectes platessa]